MISLRHWLDAGGFRSGSRPRSLVVALIMAMRKASQSVAVTPAGRVAGGANSLGFTSANRMIW